MTIMQRCTKLKDPKVCRIFFSSPFNGMEGEREDLTRKYWPQIQSLCNSSGVQFVPVDMRWGITSDLSDSAQTILICLREIDRSDMFVGFFGQRYGWHGLKDEALQRNFDAALPSYPWLANVRDRSVTELEFLAGHLNNVGKLPACICFRDKAYDDLQKEKAVEAGKMTSTYKYCSESEEATEMMNCLKQRVKQTEQQCLAVHMAYTDPTEGAQFMFNAIWKHLSDVLLNNFPNERLTEMQVTTGQHEAYAETRRGIYLGGQSYFDYLNQHISSAPSQPLAVLGSSGIGKSALLSNWIQHMRRTHTDHLLAYHFVACASRSGEIDNILQHLIWSLEQQLKATFSYTNANSVDAYETNASEKMMYSATRLVSMETRELVRELQIVLQKIVVSGRYATIVIDGLNLVEDKGKTAKPLFWLPESFPAGIHVIVATLSSDVRSVEELVECRGYKRLDIDPLDSVTKVDITRDSLMLRGKQLSDRQLELVIQSTQTSNPLFLKILLEELCMFGKFFELETKIQTLVSSQSSQELFGKYLERLENDYNSNKEWQGNMVEQVLCMLCVSRHGLSESQLTSMLQIPSHLWSPLYYALEKYLLRDGSGQLSFAYTELKDAVVARYFQSSETRKLYLQRQIDFFLGEYKTLREKEIPLPSSLLSYLPWLCFCAENKSLLLDMIKRLDVFTELLRSNKHDLLTYWQYLGCSGDDIVSHMTRSINVDMVDVYNRAIEDLTVVNPAQQALAHLSNLCLFLEFAYYHGAHEKVLLRRKKIATENEHLPVKFRQIEINETHYGLACLYTEQREHAKALECHLVLAKLYENMEHKNTKQWCSLGQAYHGAGTAYIGLERLEEAEEAFNKSIDIHRTHVLSISEQYVMKSLSSLAFVHYKQGLYEQALAEYENVCKKEKEIYFGFLPADVAYTLTHMGICYRMLERFDDAQAVYERALQIKLNARGSLHSDVALAYVNLGNLKLDVKQLAEAEAYFRRALEVFQSIGLEGSVDACRTMDNLALVLILQNKAVDAEPYFWKVFEHQLSRDEIGDGLAVVDNNMLIHFHTSGQYDKVIRVAPPLIRSRLVDPIQFVCLHKALQAMPAEARPLLTRGESLDYGLETFPRDAALVECKITCEALPSKNLQSCIALLEGFCAASESSQKSEHLVMAVSEKLDEAGWKEGALGLLEHFRSSFPDSEGLLRNLGVLYASRARCSDAIDCFQAAYHINSSAWILQRSIVILALQMANVTLAEQAIHELEQNFADDPQVQALVKQLTEAVVQAQTED